MNMVYLRNYDHIIGDTIRGVIITRSGMIAACHLGGPTSLKLFLNSKGRINRQDAFGTTMADYLRKFSYYDLDSYDGFAL
jgi:hypothetical protein